MKKRVRHLLTEAAKRCLTPFSDLRHGLPPRPARFFAGGENEFWLGETGILPGIVHVLMGIMFYGWMRFRGPSWRELTQRALNRSTRTAGGSTAPLSSPAVRR